jgi:heterodisulfide reductase subunit A-like polyferredoxin
MDAVIGMEGNGPHNGETRAVGLLMASTSPLALDVVAGEIMGLAKDKNPILIEAEKRGLSPVSLDQLELIGAAPQDLQIPDFKLPSTVPGLADRFFGLLHPIFKNAFSVFPRVIESKCISCGTCRDACPMHVITVENKISAAIDTKNCIRCYCCHEMCPHNAIELHTSRLYRLLNRIR